MKMQTNILEYLEASAQRVPQKIAYADENSELSFGELLIKAKHIGSYIDKKIEKQGPVLVYMHKSPECLAGFFGALYAGCAYVPLDTQMPSARVSLIDSNLEPVCILTDEECSKEAEQLFEGRLILTKEAAYKSEIDESALESIRACHLDTNPAYILYTSGSTGVPKGVVVPHRSLIDYMEHFCPEVGVREDDVIANQAPFYFDASLIDIYCTLKMGATMYIVPIGLFSLPLKLLEFLQEHKVTMIRWVPSALNMVSAFRALKSLKPEYLRLIIFGAESMPTKCYNYWKSYYTDATFVQIYGPTEITGVCTYYIVNREYEDTQTIPIGKAFGNSGVFLLDEKDCLIDESMPEVIGEICVKGTCLSSGYYNDFERTQAAFVQNPLNKKYPELVYRTGDLASYNEYGELVFASRKDFQIKHMGHRIELGEIEAAALSVDGIKNAVCLFDAKKSKIHMVCCFTDDNEAGLDNVKIIDILKDRLPRYMIPNVLHILDALPMTASGKADRVKLKSMFIGE